MIVIKVRPFLIFKISLRVRETERQGASMQWFTPQIPDMARPGSVQNWEPRIQSGSSLWVAGTESLISYPLEHSSSPAPALWYGVWVSQLSMLTARPKVHPEVGSLWGDKASLASQMS